VRLFVDREVIGCAGVEVEVLAGKIFDHSSG
jgi:hypothetical protein